MDWMDGLRARAKAAGLAGGNVEWRERKGGLPALVLTVVSDPRPLNLKSEPANRPSRVQVDAWAASWGAAEALASAAIAALEGAGTFYGVHFGRAVVLDPGVVDRGENTETGFVHRASCDLQIWHD